MWSFFRRQPQIMPLPMNAMMQNAKSGAADDVKNGAVNTATSAFPNSESLLAQEVEGLYNPQHNIFSQEDSRFKQKLQPLYRQLVEDYNDLIKIRQRLGGRPIQIYLSIWKYITIVSFLVAMEFAFNFQVYSAVLRHSPIASGALAIGITAAVLLIAHFAGMKIRRGRIVLATSLIVICTFLIVVFSGVRIGSIHYQQSKKQSNAGDFESMQFDSPPLKNSNNITATNKESPQGTQPRIIFDFVSEFNLVALLFLTNMIFLIAALLGSYYSHDPDADYESVKGSFDQTYKKASKFYHQREANADTWQNTRNNYIDNYQRIIDTYRGVVQRLVGKPVEYIKVALDRPKQEGRYFPLELKDVTNWNQEPQMKQMEKIFNTPISGEKDRNGEVV